MISPVGDLLQAGDHPQQAWTCRSPTGRAAPGTRRRRCRGRRRPRRRARSGTRLVTPSRMLMSARRFLGSTASATASRARSGAHRACVIQVRRGRQGRAGPAHVDDDRVGRGARPATRSRCAACHGMTVTDRGPRRPGAARRAGQDRVAMSSPGRTAVTVPSGSRARAPVRAPTATSPAAMFGVRAAARRRGLAPARRRGAPSTRSARRAAVRRPRGRRARRSGRCGTEPGRPLHRLGQRGTSSSRPSATAAATAPRARGRARPRPCRAPRQSRSAPAAERAHGGRRDAAAAAGARHVERVGDDHARRSPSSSRSSPSSSRR